MLIRVLKIEWKVLTAFFIAVSVLVVLGFFSLKNGREYVLTNAAVAHTNEVLANIEQLLVANLNIEVGQRGFELTGREEFLEPYVLGVDEVSLHLDSVRKLTSDNARQQERLDTLERLIDSRLLFSTYAIGLTREWLAAVPHVDHETFLRDLLPRRTANRAVMSDIRRIGAELRAEETMLLNERMSANERNVAEFNQTFLALVLFVGIVLIGVYATIRANLKKLLKVTERLRVSNAELDAFCYSVSHDLRAPLRSINGYSKILLEDYSDKLDQEGQKSLNTVMSNARKMGKLIDDLLNFSQIGKTTLRSAVLQMDKIVDETVAEQQESKNGNIVVDIRQLAPVKGDLGLIKQVWTNLISNAIKYSSKVDFPKLEIGSTVELNRVVYYIKDNGVGFDMIYAHKLFGVFQRLHKSADFEGTGVGLSIINRIILRHGGQVWAEGKVDQGATFYFSLPI